MSYAGKLGGCFAGSLGGHVGPKLFSAYRFDTGLAVPVRTIVQNSVGELLRRLDGASGGYLACLEPTSTIIRGGADDDAMSDLKDQVAGRMPCVLVSIGDQDFAPAGDVHQTKGTLTIPVYICGNSMRSRLDRFVGDATSAASPIADPGSFVILEHVRQLLHGHKPGTVGASTKELRIKHERMIWNGEDMTIWEQLYDVVVSYTGTDHRDVTLALKQLETYSHAAGQKRTDPPMAETSTTVGT